MEMYQLKYLFCFGKLSPSSPFMLNQAQNSKYNTTREFKLWQSLHTEHKLNKLFHCFGKKAQ